MATLWWMNGEALRGVSTSLFGEQLRWWLTCTLLLVTMYCSICTSDTNLIRVFFSLSSEVAFFRTFDNDIIRKIVQTYVLANLKDQWSVLYTGFLFGSKVLNLALSLCETMLEVQNIITLFCLCSPSFDRDLCWTLPTLVAKPHTVTTGEEIDNILIQIAQYSKVFLPLYLEVNNVSPPCVSTINS